MDLAKLSRTILEGLEVRLAVARSTPLLPLVALAALTPEAAHAQMGTYCFICGCTIWSHEIPVGFGGCLTPFIGYLSCYLHAGVYCMWIDV